ncbi:hypothetical protein FQN49_006057 [Arthroderma sp. PD_2]|nr:hypothetical protein FQN49_006057 [Arthroderma sp. PD_2]
MGLYNQHPRPGGLVLFNSQYLPVDIPDFIKYEEETDEDNNLIYVPELHTPTTCYNQTDERTSAASMHVCVHGYVNSHDAPLTLTIDRSVGN